MFERTMTNLVMVARENGFIVDDLWKAEYGTMKKLVRWNSKAVQLIEARLARSNRGAGTSKAVRPKPTTDLAMDTKWAASIEAAATHLYASDDKPKRITMNQLIVAADVRPYTWPTAEMFPKTRKTCESLAESAWHFYARKLLWTMRRIPIDSTGKTIIAREAGVHSAKASDVIQYFIDQGYRPTAGHLMAQLERLGILKSWAGPYPDRHYEQGGRAYVRKGLQKTSPTGNAGA